MSQRLSDVQLVQSTIKRLRPSSYMIVEGPKGIGKTCVIRTAVNKRPGVVIAPVYPSTKEGDIVHDVLRRLCKWTNLTHKILSPEQHALAVLFWYRRTGGKPTVVLEVKEIAQGDLKARVHTAARDLAVMGLTVILDASSNSIAEEAMHTNREFILHMEAVGWEQVKQIEDFKPLISKLEKAGVSWLVEEVCGGEFATLEQLAVELFDIDKEEQIEQVVNSFIMRKLQNAIRNLANFCIQNSVFLEICNQFKNHTELPSKLLTEAGSELTSPCKVLRVKGFSLVPVNAPMACVLFHGWSDSNPPTLKMLEAALKKPSLSEDAPGVHRH